VVPCGIVVKDEADLNFDVGGPLGVEMWSVFASVVTVSGLDTAVRLEDSSETVVVPTTS